MNDRVGNWRRALGADVAPGPADEAGQDLVDRWSQPHREYHTLEHLDRMLSIVDDHAELAEDANTVRLAAWFHDAVYDPDASDNEERSALLAREVLDALALPPERIREVVRLVLLTAGHRVRPDDRNGSLMADADLAILAAEPDEYDAYARAVRREYAHVPQEAFRAGRALVCESLRKLADAGELYRIVPQAGDWTDRARGNLSRELAALTADQSGD
jgi:predicted metal-dependent HD superfamily phosphohydrolase